MKPSFNQGKIELSRTSANYLSIGELKKKKKQKGTKTFFLCQYTEEFSYTTGRV